MQNPTICTNCSTALPADPTYKQELTGEDGWGDESGERHRETVHIGWAYTWVCTNCAADNTAMQADDEGPQPFPDAPIQP